MLKPLAVALGLSLACLAVDAAAQEPASVVATRTPDGMVVRYALPAPTTRVVFADKDIIRDRWSVATPGLTLAEGAITSDQPFDAFELRILPDAAEVDRIYMGLTRAGDGRVVYGPGLKLEGMETTLGFDLAEGETTLPETGGIEGYAWVGPASDVTAEGDAALVLGTNVDPELKTALGETFSSALAFYHARLGADLPTRATLVGSVDSPGPALFRGDVTDTGVISVRFHGEAWRQEMPLVTPFVWHEAFHLWNGHGVELRDGDSAPWLHEGGADYAAVVGAVTADAMSETTGRARIAQGLNGCRRSLADADLDPAKLRSGSGPYSCGILIQWIADLEARKAGTGDVFTLWKTMLDAARVSPTGYGASDFRTLIGPDSAVAVLLDGPGATRWATIRSRLSDLGVTLENRPDDRTLRGTALMHVAEQNCPTGSYGFYDNPGELKLDGANCGALSGEPIIDTIEGFDPQRASRAMFDAVQARCAAGLPVRYGARDGRTLEATCDKPLAEPEVWAIAEAPPLSVKAP
ncbi:hypothetical protein ACETK8_18160 [Brevundimonas staleyi]|uniref:Peptidase M61 catalytic domain-containing protein n=1 Tax=Brevundimonas staleyi TaxID=74326 RepID=A0ABW0FPC0_9CAUL